MELMSFSRAHGLTTGRLVAPVGAVHVSVALPHRGNTPAVPTLELRLLTFCPGTCEEEGGGTQCTELAKFS